MPPSPTVAIAGVNSFMAEKDEAAAAAVGLVIMVPTPQAAVMGDQGAVATLAVALVGSVATLVAMVALAVVVAVAPTLVAAAVAAATVAVMVE
ncbi:hypothetical protein CCP3SC5AM1_2900002 [Gammaproteobacteria bacterium]